MLSHFWEKLEEGADLLTSVGPLSDALCVTIPQEWHTHQNAFHASRAPSAINQVRSTVKCVPETPILRKEPKNA